MGKRQKEYSVTSAPIAGKPFGEHFDTLYYGRHLNPDEVHTILQSHVEGSSLRGVSRISGRAYGTVVSLIRETSQKAQMIHNAKFQALLNELLIVALKAR